MLITGVNQLQATHKQCVAGGTTLQVAQAAFAFPEAALALHFQLWE